MDSTLMMNQRSPMHGGQDSASVSLEAGILNDYSPLGFDAGDDNLYRYVDNDPTDETDPTGLAGVAAQSSDLTPQQRYTNKFSEESEKISAIIDGSGESRPSPRSIERYVRNGGVSDQQAALLDIRTNQQEYIDSIAAQFVQLYLKAYPVLDKSTNLNETNLDDMIRSGGVRLEAKQIAALYVQSVEKMLMEHPQTVRYYVRGAVVKWWNNTEWPWGSGAVNHLNLQTCNCIEWQEQVYNDLAANIGKSRYKYFDVLKGNSSGWHGVLPYQHNFVVITVKGHGPDLAPKKDPWTLILDPWPELRPFVYPPENNWAGQNPTSVKE
jgi:hypothetical protein